MLSELLPHIQRRLTSGWDALLRSSGKLDVSSASAGKNTLEDSDEANEEIVQERLLRELTAEYLILLRMTQDSPVRKPLPEILLGLGPLAEGNCI